MDRSALLSAFDDVRETTERLCQPLVTEDYCIQSMPDVSPPKWHLAHTSWFFEQVILTQHLKDYKPYNETYFYLFNSYYQSFGERWRRDIRGTLSRPTVRDIYDYRLAVNERMREFMASVDDATYKKVAPLIELGLHHEQQHQELLVTDIKHILATSPLMPVYREPKPRSQAVEVPHARFISVEGGVFEMGASGESFAWDNEMPRHKTYVSDFALMNRLVTCGEFLEFINDGGYRNPLLWLADGWDWLTREHWEAPLYWQNRDGQWHVMTLGGLRPLDPTEPVAHVSYYEAAAYARWADKRLPTEGASVWVVRTFPDSRAYGAEVELAVTPTTGLRFLGAGTFLTSKSVEPGGSALTAGGVPSVVANLSATYSTGGLTLLADWHFVGKRDIIDADYNTATQKYNRYNDVGDLPAYHYLNLGASYSFPGQVITISADLLNVYQSKGLEEGNPRLIATGGNPIFLARPILPRRGVLTLRYQF